MILSYDGRNIRLGEAHWQVAAFAWELDYSLGVFRKIGFRDIREVNGAGLSLHIIGGRAVINQYTLEWDGNISISIC